MIGTGGCLEMNVNISDKAGMILALTIVNFPCTLHPGKEAQRGRRMRGRWGDTSQCSSSGRAQKTLGRLRARGVDLDLCVAV